MTAAMRGAARCHEKDITCADYHHKLGLIATGAQDNTVKLFGYEKIDCIHSWPDCHKSEIALVHFICDFPLLLTSDLDGNICIWLTKYNTYQPVLFWSNTPGVMRTSLITAVDSYYTEDPRTFLLILGDEAGQVRIEDISAILDNENLK